MREQYRHTQQLMHLRKSREVKQQEKYGTNFFHSALNTEIRELFVKLIQILRNLGFFPGSMIFCSRLSRFVDKVRRCKMVAL